ncbi:MAG: histidine kinase [Burkholderiaceae bacterium]|jgi:hypothetical protein|nr:histidine kinase [Burkholderiaceae bacterium]
MSSLTTRDTNLLAAHEAPAGVRFLRAALASTTWREAAYFLLTGLAVAALNGASSYEFFQRTGDLAPVLHGVAFPLLVGPIILVGWVVADRAERSTWQRHWRLAAAVGCAAAIAVALVPPLLDAVGLRMPLEVKMDGKQIRIPAWAMYVESWLHVAIYSALTVAVLELRRRGERSAQVLQAALTARSHLSRQVLESRLAAMQAQVEPQFLFDSLVDVQATYDRDSAIGADVMDRLINYLRVALPRLREQGSTVQAEVELLAAYLGVVAARHAGRPTVHVVVAPDAADARFYPMLLLPLVQRAMRLGSHEAGGVPARVEAVVKRHGAPGGAELGVLLRIAAGDLCAEDPELARVRERLAGLYGTRATLACSQTDYSTEFALRVPA